MLKQVKQHFRKIRNTYLTPRFIFKHIITEDDFSEFLNRTDSKRIGFGRKVFHKLFYFWPTLDGAISWSEGKKGEYRDPEYFVSMREGIDKILLEKIVSISKNENDSILDLGCNSGRHMNYLYSKGLRNLTGVDIMTAAIENFKATFKKTYDNSEVNHDLFERYLLNAKDNQFDIIYSVGATIELVHPAFDIIGEMCRVAKNYILLLTQEDIQSFPRYYVREYKSHGYELIDFVRPIENTNISFLCFRKVSYHA